MQIKIAPEVLEAAVAKDASVRHLKDKIIGWRDSEKRRYHSFDLKIAEYSEQLKAINDKKWAIEAQARLIRRKIAMLCARRAYRRGPLLVFERKIKARIRELKRQLVTDTLRSNRGLLEKELDEHELDLTGKVAKKGEHFRTIEHDWAPGRPRGRPKGSVKKANSPTPSASVPVGGNSTLGDQGPASAGPDTSNGGSVERAMVATSLADQVAKHSFGGGNDNLEMDATTAARLAAGGDPAKTD